MQCAMKFFEVMPLGNAQGLVAQKVAVKMPGGKGGTMDSDGFAEIMSALMSLNPEQLNQSLEKLEWVTMGGDSNQLVPLLDLTNAQGQGANVVNMLLGGAQGQNGDATLAQLKLRMLNTAGGSDKAQAKAGDLTDETLDPAVEMAAALDDAAMAADAATDGEDGAALLFPGKGKGKGIETAAQKFASTPAATSTKEAGSEGRRVAGGNTGENGSSAAKVTQATTGAVESPLQASVETPDRVTAGVGQTPTKQAETDGKAVDVLQSGIEPGGKPTNDLGKAGAGTTDQDSLGTPATGGAANASSTRRDADSHDRRHAPGSAESMGANTGATSSSTNDTAATSSTTTSGETFQAVASRTETARHGGAEKTGHETDAALPKDLQQDVMRQIVQRMTLRTDGRQSQMQIKLKPEFLGNLRMEVMAENQQVTIRMTAESHAVKEMIEHNLHVLKAELQQHGLQIQKFDVQVSQDSDLWRNSQEHAAFGRQARQGGQGGNRQYRGGQAFDEESDSVRSPGGRVGTMRSGIGEVDFFA